MAARRLIAILIVLMLVSTFAAALAPQREEEPETTQAETTTTESSLPSGELIERVIPARPKRPVVIDAQRGDQVSLVVRVAEPQQVAIAGLGLNTFATRGDPARFDFLVRERRRLTIEVGRGAEREVVGRIDVG